MIGVIGIKRLLLISIFVAINAALALAIYMYILPQKEIDERQLRSVRSQVGDLQSDISRLEVEFEQIEQQQDRFNDLKKNGFFSNQTRSDAKKLFSELQVESKVVSAVVSVRPGVIEDNEEAYKAAHKVLSSTIEVDITAFDDADVYTYLDLLEKRFPGHISLSEMTIERTMDVNSTVLRAIASGANPEMVKASIKLLWRTMIPEAQVISGDDK